MTLTVYVKMFYPQNIIGCGARYFLSNCHCGNLRNFMIELYTFSVQPWNHFMLELYTFSVQPWNHFMVELYTFSVQPWNHFQVPVVP